MIIYYFAISSMCYITMKFKIAKIIRDSAYSPFKKDCLGTVQSPEQVRDTVAYAFMAKSTRISNMMYKNKGTKLLNILHIKPAAVDFQCKIKSQVGFYKMQNITWRDSY